MRIAVKILKAAADRNRIRILKILQHKDGACVCEIQKILGVGQSTTSRHLRILEEADLIYTVREGKWINCFLNDRTKNREVKGMLQMLGKWLEEDRQTGTDLKSLKTVDRSSLCQSE
ncbi:MAG: metalloregulator ArsR/SmtB family transcription factor [Candidatus Eremiobacteraeota bacterium]|nr:metalloregulator ArsR/SmtB family transcription factor [Candidatus Eremiobacteraeota bacterium]